MNTTETTPPGSLERMVRLHRVTDKSVRDMPVKAKLKAGQIIVEQSLCGIVFSFPAAVWPQGSWKQAQWVERLTPWWDMDAPGWTAQCQRLRDACRGAINNLLHGATPAPKTANVPQGMGLPATVSANVRGRPMQPNDPSSATRPAGRHDCNSDAMAGFAAAHG